MSSPEQDYTRKSWQAVAALVAVLVAVSFIPPQSIGGVKLRRANILSDLIRFDDAQKTEPLDTPQLFDEEEFRIDLHEVAERIGADSLPRKVTTTYEWLLADTAAGGAPAAGASRQPLLPADVALVPVEEADSVAHPSFRSFCDTLLTARRPVRIAVLGDSFIEGDILTADLREELQQAFGGIGPGFAPMASPLTAFRRTIRTQAKGWSTYNIMQYRNTPAPLRSNYYVSGWVCQPVDGASTRWETTDYRDRASGCSTARTLFIAGANSRIEVTVNDSVRREFVIPGDASVRQLLVRAPRIRSFGFRVLGGAARFVGYGTLFEGHGPGVTVDNYSIRSNNGQAMFRTNPAVNAQIDALLHYDLVILQYGLNIMQQGVSDYRGYATQIGKMIAFVRQCFPGAALLVLGVSDRSVKSDGEFEPMDALPYMLHSQRQAARDAGAAFWSTCDAMRAEGGMARFVQQGWAGKDFTHINYAGGRRIARALAAAILAETERLRTARECHRSAALLDSARRAEIDRRLLPSAVESLNPPQQ